MGKKASKKKGGNGNPPKGEKDPAKGEKVVHVINPGKTV